MDGEDLITQLLREQGKQINDLAEKVARLSVAVEQLTGRVEDLEKAVHTPPCRSLERLEDRLAHIENWRHESMTISRETKGRWGNLFWALVTNASVAALSCLGTLVAMGFKVWHQQ